MSKEELLFCPLGGSGQIGGNGGGWNGGANTIAKQVNIRPIGAILFVIKIKFLILKICLLRKNLLLMKIL